VHKIVFSISEFLIQFIQKMCDKSGLTGSFPLVWGHILQRANKLLLS